MNEIAQMTAAVREFRDARDWKQFHSVKNLVASVAIEAAELMECVQWTEGEDAEAQARERKERIADEMADVAIYLLALGDWMGIDLQEAVGTKLEKNAERYPVDRAKGRAEKYDQL